jgi:hypothetical protein
MKGILSDISSWSILKWIILVLIAGFIGQFGKMAANAIAAKIRARRVKKDSPSSLMTPPAASTGPSVSLPSSPDQIPDKKLLKAMAKAKKKEAKKK